MPTATPPAGVEPAGEEGAEAVFDPAASSAASDPLPGAKRRGRPPGSKTKRPQSAAQIEQRRLALAKGRTRPGPTDAQLRESIAALYGMTGFGLGWVDSEVGQTLAECGATAADAWVRLGQQNPAVRRVLVQVTTAGAASELFVAHSPLVALMVARLTSRQIVTVHPNNPNGGAAYSNGNGTSHTQPAPPYTST